MKILKDPYNIYLAFLTTLVILPVLAPTLLYIGFESPAKLIYFVYSFSCHQFDNRSLHLFDYQYAWCARDTAIWTSVWLTALYVKFSDVKSIKLYWLIPFIVPIALDGGIQTIYTVLDIDPVGLNTGSPLYISNNFTRFMTGGIFGIGLSLWISPTFKGILQRSTKIKLVNSKILIAFALSFIMLLNYIFLVQVWSITSEKYKPAGTLDMIVRTPSIDFFTRRKHAVCPTNETEENDYQNPQDNLIMFECFF